MAHPFYCPFCFMEIHPEDLVCPFCRKDIADWLRTTPYTARLIHALSHPNSEVRMGAILSLGKRGEIISAGSLADCAMGWPTDVVQGLEIVRSIGQILPSPEKDEALRRLTFHPSRPVRNAAKKSLREQDPSLLPEVKKSERSDS